MQTRSC